MTRTVLAGLVLCSSTLHAQHQHQPLVGKWEVSYPAGMRMENGIRTTLSGTGTLVIESVGDSLIGTLTTHPSADVPARPPARMAGPAKDGTATLIARTEARININGQEQTGTAVSTWTIAAAGDSLSGTVARRIEGVDVPAQDPGPVTGTRRKD